MRSLLLCCALLLGLLALAGEAEAGGLEYTGQGAQSLARGGAVAARAEDPMVLAHNPAGLVELRGSQFMLNLNLALFDACVDPAGYYGWGVYSGAGRPSRFSDPQTGDPTIVPLGEVETVDGMPVAAEQGYYVDPLDTVCFEQNLTPVPQLAWTRRLNEKWGIGFGLIFPSIQPSGRWGGKHGIIRGDTGELRPAPTRYMLLSSNNLGLFPTVGAAYRVSDAIRIGASFEWGIIAVNNFTMAATAGGTTPANDIIAHVKAQDWFVPAFTVSAHLVPVDALDLVVAFRFQDELKASGDIDLTTGIFDPERRPFTTEGIKINSLTQGMPWKLRAGIRYADRITVRPSGSGRDEADPAYPQVIHDPLQDERWDIELDVEYQMNSKNDAQVLKYERGRQLFFAPADPEAMLSMVDFPNPAAPDTVINKQWKDQISVRLGSTVNLLPGVLGVSAGAHFESSGVSPEYMQIDFWPVARLGLHGGLIVRVAKSIDFVFSYAHIFQETVVVQPPAHKPAPEIDDERAQTGGRAQNIDKRVGAALDRAGTGVMVLEEMPLSGIHGTAQLNQQLSRTVGNQPPYIVNSGRYYSNFDIFALGVNVHF